MVRVRVGVRVLLQGTARLQTIHLGMGLHFGSYNTALAHVETTVKVFFRFPTLHFCIKVESS